MDFLGDIWEKTKQIGRSIGSWLWTSNPINPDDFIDSQIELQPGRYEFDFKKLDDLEIEKIRNNFVGEDLTTKEGKKFKIVSASQNKNYTTLTIDIKSNPAVALGIIVYGLIGILAITGITLSLIQVRKIVSNPGTIAILLGLVLIMLRRK